MTSEEKIRSRRFTTVITANGTIETGEEARVYVIDLHMFVTVQLHGDTPFCKTCQNGWKNLRKFWWTSYQHLLKVAEQTLQNHFVRLLFTPVEVQIGNTTYLRTSDCEICKRTNITRALCRRRINSGIFRATKFGDTATAEQKRPQRRMRTAQQSSVCNRCARF